MIGVVRLLSQLAGACVIPLLRFLSPLIEPDLRISRIRLSGRFHDRLTGAARLLSLFMRVTPIPSNTLKDSPFKSSVDFLQRRFRPSPSRRASSGMPGFCRGLPGSSPIPPLAFLPKRPEARPLPSTGITRLHRYYGPFRLPPPPRP